MLERVLERGLELALSAQSQDAEGDARDLLHQAIKLFEQAADAGTSDTALLAAEYKAKAVCQEAPPHLPDLVEALALTGPLGHVKEAVVGQVLRRPRRPLLLDGLAVVVDEDNITAFKFKAGVNYEASESLDVYGELWGQTFDDFTIGTLEFEDCGMAGVSLGLRYKL